MSDTVRVGVIGCGKISGAYFGMAKNFSVVEVTACADLNVEAARAKAAEFNVPRVLTVDELITDPAVDVVLNLTVPKAHYPIAIRSIEAGKHTFAEKPLGVNREEGQKILAAAKQKGVRVGCARHVHGRRHPDRPQADRRRGHRHARLVHRHHGRPGARSVAPQPRVLLRGRRGADVRHGALLPHRAAPDARPGEAGVGVRGHPDPRAGHHQPAEVRQEDQGRDARPRDGADGIRGRGDRDHRAELRVAALHPRRPPADHGVRHRRRHSASPTPTRSTAWSTSAR